MITMQEWMELVDYKITEGTDYGWDCYGKNSYCLTSWNGIHDKGGYSVNIVFSTKSQKIYEVDVHDHTNDCAYRMQHPDYVKKYNNEAKSRGVIENQAWDDVKFIDLEVESDFIQKCKAIVSGESYDTNISVPLDIDDESLLKLMMIAHEENISFNQFINNSLQSFLEKSVD